MIGLLQLIVRILALVGKEITEVFRRPGAVLSLVLGPFLILAVFGLGYQGFKSDLLAIVVVSPDSTLPKDLASYQDLAVRGVQVVEVLPDRAAAEAKLRADQVDIVIVPRREMLDAPFVSLEADYRATLERSGRQSQQPPRSRRHPRPRSDKGV